MSWGSIAATLLKGIASALGGTSAPSTAPALPADLTTTYGAASAVLHEIGARKLTLADAEAFANGVQQILVDLGIEPAIVLEASKLLEAVAPAFLGAWQSGILTAGDITNQPGGGADRRWGR